MLVACPYLRSLSWTSMKLHGWSLDIEWIVHLKKQKWIINVQPHNFWLVENPVPDKDPDRWNWMGKNKKHRTRCWFLTWSDHVVFHPEKNHDSLGAHVFEASKIHSRQWVILFRLPIWIVEKAQLRKITLVTPWRYIWLFNWLWLARHLQN